MIESTECIRRFQYITDAHALPDFTLTGSAGDAGGKRRDGSKHNLD